MVILPLEYRFRDSASAGMRKKPEELGAGDDARSLGKQRKRACHCGHRASGIAE